MVPKGENFSLSNKSKQGVNMKNETAIGKRIGYIILVRNKIMKRIPEC